MKADIRYQQPRYLEVKFEIPPGVSVADAKQFIKDECITAGKHRHPEDPLHPGLKALTFRSVRS